MKPQDIEVIYETPPRGPESKIISIRPGQSAVKILSDLKYKRGYVYWVGDCLFLAMLNMDKEPTS